MITSQGALFFGAGIDMNEWRKNITEMRRDILGLTEQTQRETQQMDISFKNLATGIGAYFSVNALEGFTRELIQVRGEFQKTEIAFGTMLQSKEKAKELMGQMVDLAAKTPFGLQEVSEGAKRLLAFQVPANEVVDTLRRMGDVAAGLGVPMGQLIHVYGQVKAQGKLMTNDLYQFMNAGIPILAELGKIMGKTEAEVKKMVGEGKVGFSEIQQVIQNMTNEGGLFFNLMEAQSGSLSGRISNLGDAWEQMLNKIGEQNEGVLYSGIDALTKLVENYEDVLRILGTLVAMYGTYRAALILTAATQRGVVAPQVIQGFINLINLIRGATVAQSALNAVSIANPYILLATAIVGLAGAVSYWVNSNKEAKDGLEELNGAIEQNLSIAAEEVSKLEELYEAATNEKKSRKERENAVKQLQALYPSMFGNISQEIIMNGKARDSYLELKDAILESAKAQAIKNQLVKLEEEKLNNTLKQKKAIAGYEKVYKSDAGRKNKNIGISDFTKTKREETIKEVAGVIKSNREIDESIRTLKKEFEDINNKNGVKKLEKDRSERDRGASSSVGGGDKKPKKGTKRELAEVYSKGSIKDLEERISLWNNAIDRADDKGNVKVRAKDKYGKEYETKTIVTLKEALEKRTALEELLSEKRAALQAKSFDEEISELERQWRVRYLLAEKYGEEVAKAQFSALKEGSYIESIQEKIKPLQLKLDRKEMLTDEELKQWQKLKEILDNLMGEKDPFTTWKEGLDEQLESVENYAEKIVFLQEELAKLTEGQKSNGYEAELNHRLQNTQKEYEKFYKDFLKEQRSFEEKSEAIRKEYDALRKKANEDFANGKISSLRYQEISLKINTEEGKKQVDLFIDDLQNGTQWFDVFQNMEGAITPRLEKIKALILAKLKETQDKASRAKLNEILININTQIDKNEGIGARFDNIKSKAAEYVESKKKVKEAQEAYNKAVNNFGKSSREAILAETALNNAQQVTANKRQELAKSISGFADEMGEYLRGSQDVVSSVKGGAEALGLSLDNAFGDALEKIEGVIAGLSQATDGAMQFAQGLASGNPLAMVSGGIKAITGIVSAIGSLFNNDKKKERAIQREKRALEGLKSAYEDLAYAAKKAFGERKYSSQMGLIQNLEEQKVRLQNMIREENSKKKTDGDKIRDWQNQIGAINRSIDEIKLNVIKDVLQTDVVDAAAKVGDALVEAFGRGESSAKALQEVANNLIKDMLKNQLNLKLQERMKPILDRMFRSSGFREDGSGGFKGVSKEQIASFKEEIRRAGEDMNSFLEGYKEIFQNLDGSGVDSLKGSIKGMSEQTADVLAGQFNAIRINTAEILKNSGFGLEALRNAVGVLAKIEQNTFNLYQIKKDISDLNSKVKGNGDLRATGVI